MEEINANLKTKVQSAITDLEQDLDKKGLESGSGSKVGSEEPIQEQDNKENVTNVIKRGYKKVVITDARTCVCS